ncbi:DUF1896 family protein [Alistipes onderdonkii]|uniref:DUF1896 family protein n=1 Tax=Alistipes onderdonkii TaxID=328813 RepID=UPI0036F293BF
MKDNPTCDFYYYRKRLTSFIEDRHPRLAHAQQLIDTRSQRAAAAYAETLASGGNIFTATARADSILYEGLIFSRFDTLYCILTTEYPEIPDKRLRVLAQDLEAPCKDVFEHYNLDDGLVNRSEYNHLISELITAVRLYFEQNPLLLRRAGRPRRNEKTEK